MPFNSTVISSICPAPYIRPFIFAFSNKVSGTGGRMFNVWWGLIWLYCLSQTLIATWACRVLWNHSALRTSFRKVPLKWALKHAIWTLWISIYRQGFGVSFFIWVFISCLGYDVRGVWFGIACAVLTGWILSLTIVTRVARKNIGGLLSAAPSSQYYWKT